MMLQYLLYTIVIFVIFFALCGLAAIPRALISISCSIDDRNKIEKDKLELEKKKLEFEKEKFRYLQSMEETANKRRFIRPEL